VSRRTHAARVVTIAVALTLGVGGAAVLVAPDLGTAFAASHAPAKPNSKKPITDAGAPAAPEFDPANQKQTSLLEAAGQANTPKPEDPTLGTGTPRNPNASTGKLSNPGQAGCIPQYGTPGQCLPLVPPSLEEHVGHADPRQLSLLWTCAEVRTLFPDGVALAKKADPLKLDGDKDGIACGQGDPA
jgi:hypothetical protein